MIRARVSEGGIRSVDEEEVGRFCAVLEDLQLILAAAANNSERQQQLLRSSHTHLIEQLQAIMREHKILPELLTNLQELLGFKVTQKYAHTSRPLSLIKCNLCSELRVD